jgi:CubicO group peptidase (beta-lactamase class C family)
VINQDNDQTSLWEGREMIRSVKPLCAAASATLLALAACQSVSLPMPGAEARPAVAATETTTRGVNAERAAVIRSVLQGYVDQNRLAGAVVLVQRDGQPVYSTAVGWRDREARSAMGEDTVFRIASQTKALVSVAIMMLQEDGRLLVDDPLGKYLPEWQKTTVGVAKAGGGYDVVPAKRPITIRDLLTHTAGVSYGTGPSQEAWKAAGIQGWYFADRTERVSQVVARMAALPQAAQPGEQFVYGYNTDILGVVVEKVSGQTLEQFLRDRITGPLGMTDTHFYLPPDKAGRLAAVYSAGASGITRAPDPGTWQGNGHIGQGHYLNGPRIAFSGGAGLVSTARDYGRFLQMLLNGGELDGKRILSRKSVELMSRDHIHMQPFNQAGTGFGLGFRVWTDMGKAGDLGTDGMYGWGGAYHSTYWVDPKEGLTVVFLTQLIPAGDMDIQPKIQSLVYQALQ